MGSFLVHIYHRNRDVTPNGIDESIGVVEGIDDESRRPFTNRDELWEILTHQHTSPAGDDTGGTPFASGNSTGSKS
jgi:hypothetical protein